MTNTRTNCTVSVKRNGQLVSGLTALPCLVLPARAEILDMNGMPAGKMFEFMFPQIHSGLREQDQLIRDTEDEEADEISVRVTGVMHVDTPRAPHTEGVAEGMWGVA
jgi:hypothetical protein